MNRVAALVCALLPALAAAVSGEAPRDDYHIQLRAAIHVGSVMGSGKIRPERIAEIAREHGISVVVFTERDLMRWEYGQWPLRRIISKRVEHNSIMMYGPENYLNEIRSLRHRFPDMIFIEGAESAPFYYWKGSPLRGKMEMFDWHRHILAIGLKEAEDYERLPVIGNRKGLRKDFQPFLMWPLLLVLVGVAIAIVTGPSRFPKLRPAFGVLLAAAGLVFFINNWPFYTYMFDAYHGDRGVLPYQNYIDYVADRGGMTFWAHPEAENVGDQGGIHFETREHTLDLQRTRGYTGFSVFYEGYKRVGRPDGLWDTLLEEYLAGMRDRPVWAICGLAFEGYADDLKNKRIRLQTAVLVRERTEDAVLDALRNGRCYAIRGQRSGEFVLDRFRVTDSSGNASGCAGETVRISGTPVIHVEGGFRKGGGHVEVKIMRNGRTIAVRDGESPFHIRHTDGNIIPERCYYRLEIRGSGVLLVSNPIFVHKRGL
jgi:hypothetical protein